MATQDQFQLLPVVASLVGEDVDEVRRRAPKASFLALGGDSISATQLEFAARDAGIDLDMSVVLGDLTLQDLDKRCSQAAPKENGDKPQASATSLPSHQLDRASEQTGVPKSKILDVFPFTGMQQSLWADSQRERGINISRRTWRLPVTGLDLDKFKEAWQAVAKVNPILTARCFSDAQGACFLAVIDEQLDWQCVEGGLAPLKDQPVPPMTLGSRLAHFTLCRGHAGSPSYFNLVIHHVLYDGWSFRRLILHDFHDALRGHELKSRPSLHNVMEAQRRLSAADAKTYWREQLKECPQEPFPEKPTADFAPKGTQSLLRRFALPSSTTTKSLNGLVAAAWSTVLSRRYSGDNVLFGTIVWGRTPTLEQALDIAYPTFNKVPVVERCSPDRPVRELISSLSQKLWEYNDYSRVADGEIASASEDARRACNFTTTLNVQPPSEVDPDAVISEQTLEQTDFTGATGLLFMAVPHEGDLRLRAIFDERMISTDTVTELLAEMETAVLALQKAEDTDLLLRDVTA